MTRWRPLYLLFGWLAAACTEDDARPSSSEAVDRSAPAGTRALSPQVREVTPAAQNRAAGVGSAADRDEAAAWACFPAPSPPPAPPQPRVDPEQAAKKHSYFSIATVEALTGRALPEVELRTTSQLKFITDAQGTAHFYEPGLMERPVYFHVQHDRYALPTDEYGQRGIILRPREGERVEIALNPLEPLPTRRPEAPPLLAVSGKSHEQGTPDADHCFGIRAVDAESQRGVPLVGLSTAGVTAWTDSQGWAALCDPSLFGQAREFAIETHGYHLTTGHWTATLSPTAGGRATLQLRRELAAERLYRTTGQGIYQASVLLGFETPLHHPLLDGEVTGQDTSDSERYRGALFWIWGDTQRVDYALGNFRASAATSTLPSRGGLQPDLGVNLTYFEGDDGFAKPMTEDLDEGRPIWINGLAAVHDGQGQEQLFAGYMVANPDLSAAETGVMRYDPEAQLFRPILRSFPERRGLYPDGNSYRVRHGGGDYIYFRNLLRVPARAEAFQDREQYEVYSAHDRDGSDTLVLTPAGEPAYAFRRGAQPTTAAQLGQVGIAAAFSLDGNMREFGTGRPLDMAAPSESFSHHRGRFLRIGQQRGGDSSYLGEVWLSEADSPMGPWVYSERIVTHRGYTFYNVRQHPDLTGAQDRLLYFGGTFTTTFAAQRLVPVPRYDYNQIMYRLDLEDERVRLPVAVYELTAPATRTQVLALKDELPPDLPPLRAAFFALDRPRAGAVAAYYSGPSCRPRFLHVGAPPRGLPPLFYGLPITAQPAPPDMVPLFVYENAAGEQRYGVETTAPPGYGLKGPLLLVWRNPSALSLPISDYLGEIIAQAGPDRCLSADPEERSVTLTLDGRASRSLRGPIERFRWRVQLPDRCLQIAGEQTTVNLPLGRHSVSLEVQSALGAWDRDSLVVEVVAADEAQEATTPQKLL